MKNKGKLIALVIASGFEGQVGPCGGEDPIVKDNEIILYSQLPECGYRFNNDGSVDCFFPDKKAMYESFIHDIGLSEEEAEWEIEHPTHYNSIFDLLGNGEDGWFYFWDRNDLNAIIEKILEVKDDD